MDTQHRQIFSICAGLEDLAEAYSPELFSLFYSSIIELIDCAEHHFLEEEFLYQELEREGLAQHQGEHANYLRQLKAVKEDASLGVVDPATIKRIGTR